MRTQSTDIITFFLAGNLDGSVKPTQLTQLHIFDRKTVLYAVLAVNFHILSRR